MAVNVLTLYLTLFLGHGNVDWFHLVEYRIQKLANVEYSNEYLRSVNHGGFHDNLQTCKFLTETSPA